MGNVLIVAEQRDGELKKPTLHAISAGRVLAEKTGGVCFTVVFGSGVDKAAKDVAICG